MQIPSLNSRRKARIEIIPLIDIIFFLLATFVMVSLSMIQNQGIAVHLPKASSGSTQDRCNDVTITVTIDGSYFFNHEPITHDQLLDKLLVVKKTSVEPQVFINADTKADFGSVVEVLNEVRKQGIEKVAIETKPTTDVMSNR
ncbi:MAG: ExbD/TolR family protein [Chthoniobacterales bacterium]